MKPIDIVEGIHKDCGGYIRIYEQNYPTKYLVGCTLCGDYYNTETLPEK
jgi:hypothetical protein